LGRARHPDAPYASPRVRAINTDARAWLNDTRETYDLIVFGTLDSMTRLTAQGGLVLYFMVSEPYIELRLGGLLTDVFGEAPLVDETDRALFNHIYMAGPAFAA